MRSKKVLFLVQAAMIAAIYVALTYVSSFFGLASGTIQVRISEALCVLPVFTAAAIPGPPPYHIECSAGRRRYIPATGRDIAGTQRRAFSRRASRI